MINFLSVLFFIGILIASLQDLKRREVDNYLNFFLLVSGAAFLAFSAVLSDWKILIFGALSFLIMFSLANIFYYGRIFAGGDAKLMIAMFSLFAAVSLSETLINIGSFIFLLMISGSIYGVFYSIFLVSQNFKNFKKEFRKLSKNSYFRYGIMGAVILFALSYIDILFLFFSIFIFLGIILFILAKAVEKSCMIRELGAGELREGDWLVSSVKINDKMINPDWEGLTKKDVQILRKFKGKVRVKDGLPFVPAFFIAFLLWVFRFELFEIILNLI